MKIENYYSNSDHTFVVCAYGESEFLQECIDSLLAQEVKSNIIIATSTPNEHIRSISVQYGIELRINTQPPGICGDWNFAYKQAGTKLITLAHQDDIYLPGYLSTALEMINKSNNPIIFFTGYAEIKNGGLQFKNLRLNVKKLMLSPLMLWKKSRFVRRRILSLGSPICCPSVMYIDIDNLEFTSELSCNLDWHKWEELSRLKGSFVYCKKPLLYHRLHSGAETSRAIQDGTRSAEDYLMFKKFWWNPIAKVLARVYTKSEEDS